MKKLLFKKIDYISVQKRRASGTCAITQSLPTHHHPIPRTMTEDPIRVNVAKSTGLLLPSAPVKEYSTSPREAGCQIFSNLQLQIAETKFLATAIERLEASFHPPNPRWKSGSLTPGIADWEYQDPNVSEVEAPSWERLAEKTRGHFLQSSALLIKKRQSLSPLLAPKQGLWDCVQEERHSIKTENSKVLPKQLFEIVSASSNLKALSKWWWFWW